MRYTSEQLSSILDEISEFEVELAEDPTLPSLGSKYLNGRIALCRKYLNRVIYYLQTVGKQAKNLSVEVRQMELDLELKTAQKLADDPIVKKQPSIEDRKAVVSSMLKEEHDNLASLKVGMLDVVETLKIIKMKHQDLVRTNADIKSQRQLVKDDADTRLGGGDGYAKPQANQDRTVSDGMPPPVVQGKIDPKDLLDPSKRPEDLPEPVDEMHAQQMADFFSSLGPLNNNPVDLGSESSLDLEPAEENKMAEENDKESSPRALVEWDDDGVKASIVDVVFSDL